MPPRVYALILISVQLAAGLTVLAVQALSLPWVMLSLLALAGAVVVRVGRRS